MRNLRGSSRFFELFHVGGETKRPEMAWSLVQTSESDRIFILEAEEPQSWLISMRILSKEALDVNNPHLELSEAAKYLPIMLTLTGHSMLGTKRSQYAHEFAKLKLDLVHNFNLMPNAFRPYAFGPLSTRLAHSCHELFQGDYANTFGINPQKHGDLPSPQKITNNRLENEWLECLVLQVLSRAKVRNKHLPLSNNASIWHNSIWM